MIFLLLHSLQCLLWAVMGWRSSGSGTSRRIVPGLKSGTCSRWLWHRAHLPMHGTLTV